MALHTRYTSVTKVIEKCHISVIKVLQRCNKLYRGHAWCITMACTPFAPYRTQQRCKCITKAWQKRHTNVTKRLHKCYRSVTEVSQAVPSPRLLNDDRLHTLRAIPPEHTPLYKPKMCQRSVIKLLPKCNKNVIGIQWSVAKDQEAFHKCSRSVPKESRGVSQVLQFIICLTCGMLTESWSPPLSSHLLPCT